MYTYKTYTALTYCTYILLFNTLFIVYCIYIHIYSIYNVIKHIVSSTPYIIRTLTLKLIYTSLYTPIIMYTIVYVAYMLLYTIHIIQFKLSNKSLYKMYIYHIQHLRRIIQCITYNVQCTSYNVRRTCI